MSAYRSCSERFCSEEQKRVRLTCRTLFVFFTVVLGLDFSEEIQLTDAVEDDHRGEDQDADEVHLIDALLELAGQDRDAGWIPPRVKRIMLPSRIGMGSRLKIPRFSEI